MSDWLTVDEAAEHMRLKSSTLLTLARGKKIRHARVNRQLVFERSWLDEYLEAHAVAVVENRFGLTDQALDNILTERATRGKKAS